MNWNRILYVFVLIVVAGIAGLTGAFAGGFAVFSAVRQNAPPPMQVDTGVSIPETPQPPPGDVIQISNTEVETTITEAVEEEGTVEQPAKQEGRNLTMVIVPK